MITRVVIIISLLWTLPLGAVHGQDPTPWPDLIDDARGALSKLDAAGAILLLDRAEAAAKKTATHDPRRAEGLRLRGTAHEYRGDHGAAARDFRAAVKILQKSAGKAAASLIPLLESAARASRASHDQRGSVDALDRVVSILDAQDAPDAVTLLRLLHPLAASLRVLGERERTVAVCRRRLTLAEGLKGTESTELSQPVKDLAQAYRTLGRNDLAEPLIERAITIHEAVRRPDHPGICSLLEDLIAVRARQKNFEGASEVATRWVRILRGVLDDHPSLHRALSAAARIEEAMGRFAQGLKRREEAVAVALRAHGSTSRPVGRCRRSLATALRRSGRLAAAADNAAQAVKILEGRLRRDDPEVLDAVTEAGACAEARGRTADAERHYRRVVDGWNRRLKGRDHPVLVNPLERLANVVKPAEAATLRARAKKIAAQ